MPSVPGITADLSADRCLLLHGAPRLLLIAALLFAAIPMPSICPVLAQRHGHARFCAAAAARRDRHLVITFSLVVAMIAAAWLARPG